MLIMLVIMNKLELVMALRKIAATQNCHLTIKAASKIADWLKDGTAYDITSYLEKQNRQWEEYHQDISRKLGH